MSSNKTVFFLIGVLLTILGSSMLIPYSIQILQQENSHSFIGASFITIFIGILFVLSNLEKQFKLNHIASIAFMFIVRMEKRSRFNQ